MSYDKLKVAELQDLCRERGLKTARAKAEMISRLNEYDAGQDISDYYGGEPAPLPDGVLPASEAELEEADRDEAQNPAEETQWVLDGAMFMRVPQHGILDDNEHRSNLYEAERQAGLTGLAVSGGAFRVHEYGNNETWLYRVNFRS